MLKRKIYNELLLWKSGADKKCLVLKGARHVGKTFIVESFARKNYKYTTTLNFEENPAYKKIFQGDLDADALIKQISIRVPDAELIPGETLLFLDEIQFCPNALSSLKFLTLDGRFDVIAAGSLLGFSNIDASQYPVGYVAHLEMQPLDFEEFLWANGVTDAEIAETKELFEKMEPVPAEKHERMMGLFGEYIVVGGMPRVVSEFATTHNFSNVLKIQRDIIKSYESDIEKYAGGAEKTKALACFLSIPNHLSKGYKKFQYSIVEQGGTARKYSSSLMWLYDAGLINFCFNLSKPELPFEGSIRGDVFKVYLSDTGLLMAMLEESSREAVIDGNFGVYKGALCENITADIFSKSGRKLYYFERNGKLEIDFFISRNKIATAIEVKSADNSKSKSMNAVLAKYKECRGIKLSKRNVEKSEAFDRIPLYLAIFL